MPRAIDSKEMLDKRFGRLTVLKEVSARLYINKKGKEEHQRYWLCLCDCGVRKEVRQQHLRNGLIVSCGCYGRDKTSARERKLEGLPEGYTRNCDQKSWQFIIWKAMIDRCYNPENSGYINYGGRGVTVCDSWLKPFGEGLYNFSSDMGERPEGFDLDRLDNSLGYCPENCGWSDRTQQCRNRRRFKNNTSGRTGVYWTHKHGVWQAQVTVDKKTIYLGSFSCIDDAIKAREEGELKYYGFIKE